MSKERWERWGWLAACVVAAVTGLAIVGYLGWFGG